MITIGDRPVGPGQPVYVVAELSANHGGELDRALGCVRAAAEAGADAVKLQTYTADSITIDCDAPDFVIPEGRPWGGRTLHELYREARTPREWHGALFEAAASLGLGAFSSPFDRDAVEFLERLDCPAYKVASFELVDDGLLRAVAATGKPVVLSTGMATLREIRHALATLRTAGAHDVVLLHCVSSYPAPDEAMNLATIPALAEATGVPVGLSDHSTGSTAAVAAVALGACLIEKHLVPSRDADTVDAFFSLEPRELAELVAAVRRVEVMRGSVRDGPVGAEEPNLRFRRSLYVVEDVAEREPFTRDNVRAIRPGYGLAPRHLDRILGARASRDLARGTALRWEHVAGGTG